MMYDQHVLDWMSYLDYLAEEMMYEHQVWLHERRQAEHIGFYHISEVTHDGS